MLSIRTHSLDSKMSNQERDFDTFMQLKKDAIQGITENNAVQELKDCQNQVIKALKTLNVHDISAVEDFYLVVARLSHAATYVIASQKANSNSIDFNRALFSVSTDDVLMLLSAAFNKSISPQEFVKIQTIDGLYAPGKQGWSGLHARMHVLAQYQQQQQRYCKVGEALKTPLKNYLSHLEEELKKHGLLIPIPTNLSRQPHNQMIEKMINRYHVIASLHSHFKDKTDFSEEDITFAKRGLKICLNNEPSWFERPFLQQLLDILSLGTTAFYRAFFSTERKLKEDIGESLQLKLN